MDIKDSTSAMVAKTVPFRNMTRKLHPLKIRPPRTGRVRIRMTMPAYMPRRAPPMICPAINCHKGVGDTITWSRAFSYRRWTLIFWATAPKLPVIVDIATSPGIKNIR